MKASKMKIFDSDQKSKFVEIFDTRINLWGSVHQA